MSLKVIVVFTGLVAMLASCTEAAGGSTYGHDRYQYPNYNYQQQYACPAPPPCPECPAAPAISISQGNCNCHGSTHTSGVQVHSCSDGCSDGCGDCDNHDHPCHDKNKRSLNSLQVDRLFSVQNNIMGAPGFDGFVSAEVTLGEPLANPPDDASDCWKLGCRCDFEQLVLTYLSIADGTGVNLDDPILDADVSVQHLRREIYVCQLDTALANGGQYVLRAMGTTDGGQTLSTDLLLPNVEGCAGTSPFTIENIRANAFVKCYSPTTSPPTSHLDMNFFSSIPDYVALCAGSP